MIEKPACLLCFAPKRKRSVAFLSRPVIEALFNDEDDGSDHDNFHSDIIL